MVRSDMQAELTPLSVRHEAALWLLRCHAGDLSIAERFEYLEWLKTSPVHIAEVLRACRLCCWLGQMKPLQPFEYEEPVTPISVAHLSNAGKQVPAEARSPGRLFVQMRNLTAIAAMISVGIGTFNMSWGVLHQASLPAESLFRALPLLGPVMTVLVSISTLAAGATIGLRAVKRGAHQ